MIDPTSLEQYVDRITAWALALASTVEIVNGRSAEDGIVLEMPREDDLIVTYPYDASAMPEQTPAIVVEIEQIRSNANVGQFSGYVRAKLRLVDGAESGAIGRTKMSRWADALLLHCRTQSGIVSSAGKIVPQNMELSMGKIREGEMNALEILLDLNIPIFL